MKTRIDRAVTLSAIWIVAIAGGCGGAASGAPPAAAAPAASPAVGSSAQAAPARAPSGKAEGSPLTDGAEVAFRDLFTGAELGPAWNLFGVAGGKREVKTSPGGLLVRVVSADKEWDAVGARTSHVRVEGDFDLRGRFRDFSADGNGSAKLIVVDAASPKGEAAYVERIRIDGKNLFKFGGEVEGSLETWGFVPTEAKGGDLRLVRTGNTLHAYFRTAETGPWSEIGAGQAAPKSMPRTVKFGVKLSAEKQKGAQVTWTELTMNGALVHTD